MDYRYIDEFRKLRFGLFVHYGLYSCFESGEWYLWAEKNHDSAYPNETYNKAFLKFNPKKTWAEDICKTAKKAGMKYVTLTTRHHDGFSLYDTRGLSDFDAPHSFCHRDLVKEFVDACHQYDLVPFFYHTVIDWQNPYYQKGDFDAYFDYLEKSIEVLLTQYGKIGGIWFDGTWGLPKGVTFPERIYKTIHRLQKEAIITNNTGLQALGEQGGKEIDCVTFERGKPFPLKQSSRPIAGEVCDSLNDHWGYAKDDIHTKTSLDILQELIDACSCGCNLLINVGPEKNGSIPLLQKEILKNIGYYLKRNDNLLLRAIPCEIQAEGATILKDEDAYYAITNKIIPTSLDEHVTRKEDQCKIILHTDKKIVDPIYLDNHEKVSCPKSSHEILVNPYPYGTSLGPRIIRFRLK